MRKSVTRHSRSLLRALRELGFIAIALVYVFPLYVVLEQSFKTDSEIARHPYAPPTHFSLANYRVAWAGAGSVSFGHAFINSMIITVSTSTLLVIVGSLAAYAIGRRLDWLGRVSYMTILLGLILPLQLAVIPLFYEAQRLGLTGTYEGMILVEAGFLVPFTVFLYTGFVRALPRSYEEAALTDGATRLQTFVFVVFPMLKPVTATVFVLTFGFVWNDFFNPLIFLSGSGHETLPVAIFDFVSQYEANWKVMFAGITMAALPVLLLYIVMQRYVIRGLTGGLSG